MFRAMGVMEHTSSWLILPISVVRADRCFRSLLVIGITMNYVSNDFTGQGYGQYDGAEAVAYS